MKNQHIINIKSVIEFVKHLILQVKVLPLPLHLLRVHSLLALLLLALNIAKLGLELPHLRSLALHLQHSPQPDQFCPLFCAPLDEPKDAGDSWSVVRGAEDEAQVLPEQFLEPVTVVIGVAAVFVEKLLEKGQQCGHLVDCDGGQGVSADLGIGVCDDFLEERAVLGGDGLLDDRAV